MNTSVCDIIQVTELSKEVFRLKEALGALSPPLGIISSSSFSSSTHHGNPGQQMALQNRIGILNQQLQVRKELRPGMCYVRQLDNKQTIFTLSMILT